MNKKLLLVFLVIMTGKGFSQISLTQTDFAGGGDTARISISSSSVDYASTGAGYSWDFSSLSPDSQELREFEDISNAAAYVQFVFGMFASSNYHASYSLPNTTLPVDQISSILPVTISDVRTYFKKSADSLTQLGFSMNVSGTDIPFKSDTIEKWYDFPAQYGQTTVSHGYTNIDFSAIVDAQWIQHRTHYSTVDGYGTITTPYGTFSATRIKHDIYETDSVYYVYPIIGGTWIPLSLPVQHQYEWWTNGEDVPLLKVTTTEFAGNETVNTIEYKDEYRGLDAGINELSLAVTVYPNPAAKSITIQLETPADRIELINMNGQKVKTIVPDMNQTTVELNVSDLPQAVYQLYVWSGTKCGVQTFVKN